MVVFVYGCIAVCVCVCIVCVCVYGVCIYMCVCVPVCCGCVHCICVHCVLHIVYVYETLFMLRILLTMMAFCNLVISSTFN